MKCSICKTSESIIYMMIGEQSICEACITEKKKVSSEKFPQIFTKWICNTHKCGSYNFNMLSRHEMDDCKIEMIETMGIDKPKTFGGYNGDVGRRWFVRDMDIRNEMLKRWKTKLRELRISQKYHTRRRYYAKKG